MHKGNPKFAKFLLQQNLNISTNQKNAEGDENILNIACHCGNFDVINLLLSQNLDPNCISDANPLAPLHILASKNYHEAMTLLISYGADLNLKSMTKEKQTALHIACSEDSYESVSVLLATGSDPNLLVIFHKLNLLNLGCVF